MPSPRASALRRRGPPRRCDRTVGDRSNDGMKTASGGGSEGGTGTVHWHGKLRLHTRCVGTPPVCFRPFRALLCPKIAVLGHEEIGRVMAEELVVGDVPSVRSGAREDEQIPDAQVVDGPVAGEHVAR